MAVKITETYKSIDDMPPLLTLQQVADILQISRKTVYDWIYKGKIKPVTIAGSLRRFRRDDLPAMMQ